MLCKAQTHIHTRKILGFSNSFKQNIKYNWGETHMQEALNVKTLLWVCVCVCVCKQAYENFNYFKAYFQGKFNTAMSEGKVIL